jgi:hypothetical protein
VKESPLRCCSKNILSISCSYPLNKELQNASWIDNQNLVLCFCASKYVDISVKKDSKITRLAVFSRS